MTTIRLHYNSAGHVEAAQVAGGPVRQLRHWRSSFGPFGSFEMVEQGDLHDGIGDETSLDVLRLLVQPYAGHPHFHPSWSTA